MATQTRNEAQPRMDTQTRSDAEARTDNRHAAAFDTQAPTPARSYDPRGAFPMNSEVREVRPAGNETKLSFLTTEFWIYLAAVAGVLIASYLVGRNANHADYFRADKAWWFIALLTIGYLGSRGLAKAGSPTRSKARDNPRR
jgi:hypothetical protein